MRVALIVDNPLRDLPGMVLVARRLCQAEALCHLVPMNLQDTELRALAPDAVLVNYLRPGNQELVRQLLEAEVCVFLSDTEGGVLPHPGDYGSLLAPDPTVRHGLAAWCAWGPLLAAHALQQGWFRDSQVLVTGAPRFDFYAHPWRQAALAASRHAEAVPTPMVLVNGNFPLANPRYETPEREVDDLVGRYGFPRPQVEAWRATQEEAMAGLVALVNHLAPRLPEISFVYRPHPFEAIAPYRDLLSVAPNVRLLQQGTVDGWVLRSAAVIQRSCTTAIDAAMAGVPALSPRWLPVDPEIDSAENVSIGCGGIDEVENHLRTILAGDHADPDGAERVLEQVLADWFHRIDGNGHARVAEAVLERSVTHDREAHLARCAAVGGPAPSLPPHLRAAATARGWLKRRLPPSARSLLRPGRPSWESSEKRFGPAEVQAVLASLAGVDEHGSASAGSSRLFVGPASAHGDYGGNGPLRHGRAVTVAPPG